MKSILLLIITSQLCHARIWTDSRKPNWTFEGDLVQITGNFAAIKLSNGKTVSLPITSFSQADQAYLKTAAAVKPEPKLDIKPLEVPASGKP